MTTTNDDDGDKRKKKKKSTSEDSSRRHRSGKSKKLTTNVPYPQRWPHTYLALHYVGKAKKYEELSIAEFCAGFATILERTTVAMEKEARIAFFRELMYFATIYTWSEVLAFHAAYLMEIERGNLKWGQSYHHLIHTTLITPARKQPSQSNRGVRSEKSKGSQGGPIRFCPKYQRGVCTFSEDHEGTIKDGTFHLRHICAQCWMKKKTFGSHPETSSSCPLFGTGASRMAEEDGSGL